MKRFLILGAVMAGLTFTGLSGAAQAGHGMVRGGYGGYGWNGGYGGYNYGSRNCWGGYRNRGPVSQCSPRPYGYGGYGSSYGMFGGYGATRGGYGCNW